MFSCLWVFGILVLDDPNFGGLRFPWTVPVDKSHGIPWRSIPKLWIPGPFPEEKSWHQFPYLPRWDKMNKKTVSNENVFQTRFLVCCFQLKLEMWSVIDSCSMLLFCSHCPMMAQRWKSWETVSQYKTPSSWGQITWYGQRWLYCFTTHRRKTSSFPCTGVDGLVV